MTLEEALRIRGDRDLPRIRGAFKEAGMPAQVRDMTTVLEQMTFVMGTIGSTRSLLKEWLAQLEEEDEDAGSLQVTNLEIVEKVAGVIAGIMERYKPGDPLPWTGLSGIGGEAGRQPPWKDEMQWFIAISTLKGNGLAREEDDRVILQKRADPESLVMALPEDIIEGIDPEILKDRGTLTPEEVARILKESVVEDPNRVWTISLNLSTEFVKGVLDDLRKIGLLSKKGTGFRAV